jgi:hypothetical protein
MITLVVRRSRAWEAPRLALALPSKEVHCGDALRTCPARLDLSAG